LLKCEAVAIKPAAVSTAYIYF